MSRAGQIFIIVFGVLFFSQSSFGQNRIQKIDWNKTQAAHLTPSSISLATPAALQLNRPFFPSSTQDLNTMNHSSLMLAKDMSVKNLAFFCRQELLVEKALKIPVKVRMGSLAQANALEGKP